jgi:hypothetical protein
MDLAGLQELFDAWTTEGRFGEPIMTISEVLALTICSLYSLKTKFGRAFFFYILFDFTIGIWDYYLMYFSSMPIKTKADFISISNICVAAVELFTYYYFFLHNLQNLVIKGIIKYLLIAFVLIVITLITFVREPSYRRATGFIGAIEFLFLLLPCITYYFELFSVKTSEDLLRRPSFWITTGIFFYSVISIPYYLIDDFLQVTKYHFRNQLTAFMFYIPFSFNFLFLSKAFLCKRALTI